MPPAPADQAFQYTLNVLGRLDDAEQFADVIVKTGTTGEITRVRDIGRVELGAQTYSQIFNLDGKPSAGMAIFQSPGANALDVGSEVKAKMAALAKEFPQGLQYSVPFDTTKFVNESINEVYKTLYEAAILVLIVILVFLQDWRAMLVPATTVPVTIIGAFAAMAALGFTVNFSTLFAIVLAIGIVVDDAIVVVEGAAHNIEKGMSGHDAAIQRDGPAVRSDHRHHAGADGGVPAGGVPAGPDRADVRAVRAGHRRDRAAQRHQCGDAQADAERDVAARGRCRRNSATSFYPRLQPGLRPVAERGYAWLIGRMVSRSGIMAAIALVIIGVSLYGFSRVPTGFLPIEDQGYLIAIVQLPDGASLAAHPEGAGQGAARSPARRPASIR